jgi:hypothetical protein
MVNWSANLSASGRPTGLPAGNWRADRPYRLWEGRQVIYAGFVCKTFVHTVQEAACVCGTVMNYV